MSSVIKRDLRRARENAEAFYQMFPAQCFERWEFAGSLRRECPTVGDVDHIIIPAIGSCDDLFGMGAPVNLFWHHLDALVAGRRVQRAIRGNSGFCWGEKHRAVWFEGVEHEIYLADRVNFGAQLTIRTGPADFSRHMMNALREHGYRQQDGYVWCVDGMTTEKVPVPDEQTYFSLAGLPTIPPRQRC